jgi:LacI family transcriptional regulator
MEEQKVRYVLLDRRFDGLEASYVGIDDHAAGFLATTHLLDQGCQRIAHIRGPEVSTANGRMEGYEDALLARRQPVSLEYVASTGGSGDHFGESGGYKCVEKLLSKVPRPDGIFCYNDPVALGAMRAILDAGLRIPEDIAVVGCGNLPYSDFLRVPLSTIDQNTIAMGESAAALALAQAQNKKSVSPKTEIIQPRLIVRASSKRIGA